MDAVQQGVPMGERPNIVNMALSARNLSDVPISPDRFVPVEDVNLYKTVSTPEHQAKKAIDNMIAAGAAASDAKGKEISNNEYTDMFSRIRPGDDGTIGIIDKLTGVLRPLTNEEQAYFENNSNLTVAEQQRAAPELIKALRQEVINRGLSIADAEQIGLQNLTGLGKERLYIEQALLHGADPSKITPQDVTNAANEERKNIALLEDIKRKAEADARTNSKTSTYNKFLSDFLDFKIAGEDGKATIFGLGPDVLAEVQSVQDQFMQFGIGADQFEKYLKLKTNDIRYNEDHITSSSNHAEQFAQNLINKVPKTGAGKTDKNGTGNTGNGAGASNEENAYSDNPAINALIETFKKDRERIKASPYSTLLGTNQKRADVVKEYDELFALLEAGKKITGKNDTQKSFIKKLKKEYDSLQASLKLQQESDGVLEFLTDAETLLYRMDQIKNAIEIKDE
jgi:hypothetical protein